MLPRTLGFFRSFFLSFLSCGRQSQKDTLIARARTAKTTTQVNDMLGNITGTTSMDAFDRMEEKVEALEASAEVSRVCLPPCHFGNQWRFCTALVLPHLFVSHRCVFVVDCRDRTSDELACSPPFFVFFSRLPKSA